MSDSLGSDARQPEPPDYDKDGNEIDDSVPFKVPDGYRVLTDEEAEKLTTQLVEDHREKWQVQEIVDNAVVAGQFNNLMRNEFYYEFKGAHGTVRGLTASMISHLATAQGITEITEERQYEKTETDHEFEVVVAMPDPMNPDNVLKRTGFSEEPIILNGKKDRFAKQKCHTKAFRNAALKLLPQDLLIATTYKLAKLVPVDWTPEQHALMPPVEQPTALQRQAEPKPEKDEATRTRERAFAMYTEHKDDLPEDFWDRVRSRFGVKSRATMTLANWRQTISLIEELLAEPEPEPDAETDGDADEDDMAIPF